MKMLLISFTFLALNVFADDSLTDMKRKATEKIDMRMSHLEDSKACISSAQTKEAFKSCNMKMNKHMQSMEHHGKHKFNKQEYREDKKALEKKSQY